MPMYDFVCPRGHKFETVVPMAVRDKPIPCEHEIDVVDLGDLTKEAVEKPTTQKRACGLMAKRVEISHSHPEVLLDHGYGLNRDRALRMGDNYDGLPVNRGVRK